MASAPPDIAELLDRGDAFVRAGDDRAAMSFYQTALQLAAAGAPIAPQLRDRLLEAQRFIGLRVDQFQSALDRSLDGPTPEEGAASDRLNHALDMLRGKREIYPQQPSVLYYPYLAQRQFFEPAEFDWAPALEAMTPVIREELVALLDDDAEFRPYIEDEANRPVRAFGSLNNDPSWSALYLWRDGKLNEEIARRCPRTVKALGRVPLSDIGARTPVVLFSRLEPGAHIPPHTGMLNCRLICHLPLIVPAGCWLRVGNETRQWEQGKLLIFDDSIQHEARNPTGELRIILLFDVWRPELTAPERHGISAIFNAIDTFQPLPDA